MEKLRTILREGIKNNGVIFDEDETQQMVDVLMMECQNELEYQDINVILDQHSELCESLAYRYGWRLLTKL